MMTYGRFSVPILCHVDAVLLSIHLKFDLELLNFLIQLPDHDTFRHLLIHLWSISDIFSSECII